ncbi:MAG: FtsW/RodA/SpoVE family cell cycle protein [Actinomycetota bacterium]|nr:FtsW/RodA/SpoVE family cell cycle protein [Actinomycetota bacterium]
MSATTPLRLSGESSLRAGRRLPGVDPLLLFAAVGLSLCSVVVLHALNGSAYYAGEYKRQAIFSGLGLLVALAISRFDYSRLREFRYVIYGLAIVLNLAVFAFPAPGGAAGASQRRIPLPGFTFQSSTFGMVLVILALSAFAVERSRRMSEHRTTARILLLGLVPAMVVMAEPDLGDALVYGVIAYAVLFFLGTSWKHLAALAALVLVATVAVLTVAPAVGVNVLHGYQRERLTTFLNPTCNTAKDTYCYQLEHGLIAIGSGQKTGTGPARASQATGGFLPQASSDFVFATLGEMYGFVGAAVVLSLYALLIWRTLRIVTMAKNLFGTLVAGSILAMLMFQIFVTVGMNMGIMPITGIPLPLMAYGGSSVITTFTAIGLLESIYVQARMSSAGKSLALTA